MGIENVLQLADADVRFIRKHFNIVLERTVRELRGEPCLELEEFAPAKQELVCSRSFGEKITGYEAMNQAIFCRAGDTVVMEDEAGEVVTLLYDAVVRFTARMGEMTIRERSYCSFRMVYSGPAYAGLWSAMSEERTKSFPCGREKSG